MTLGQVDAPTAARLEPGALDELFEKFFTTAAQRTGATPNLTEWVESTPWRSDRSNCRAGRIGSGVISV